jgi:hypothetical protein
MVIGLGAYFLTVAIPPIVNAEVLPFDLPLHGFLEGLLASVSVPYWLPERSRDTTTLFDLARRSVRWRVPTRGIVLSIHEERGSGGAPRAHVELGRHCCARTSGVVSDFTSDTAISPMSAAILAGRLGFTSGRTSRSMISSKPSADPMSVVVYTGSPWLQPDSPRRLRRRMTAMSTTAIAASASSTTMKPIGALIKYSQIAKAVQMTKPNTASHTRKVRALAAGAAPPIPAVGSW